LVRHFSVLHFSIAAASAASEMFVKIPEVNSVQWKQAAVARDRFSAPFSDLSVMSQSQFRQLEMIAG